MGSLDSVGSGPIDRPRLEREWANHQARNKLSVEDRTLWNECRHVIRPYVYFNKIFIGWTLNKGQPDIKEVLTVVSLDVSFQDGVWVRMKTGISKRDVVINHAPRTLPGVRVLAWVPFFNEIRYISRDWNDLDAPRNLRMSACFRMRDGLDNMHEGDDLVTELGVFRERFQQFKDAHF